MGFLNKVVIAVNGVFYTLLMSGFNGVPAGMKVKKSACPT